MKRQQTISVKKFRDSVFVQESDYLAEESPLEIRICYDFQGEKKALPVSVTMRSANDVEDLELSVGFLYTEGISTDFSQVQKIHKPEENAVEVFLAEGLLPDLEKLKRNFYTSSSCGVCGKSSIAALRTILPIHLRSDTIQPVHADLLLSLPEKLYQEQLKFQSTGGLHAAALFTREGELLELREDVGRHNALDKLIGSCFMKKTIPLGENILLLSGRASFELIQKAAMAGIQIVCAVGAPSSLAVELARENQITLVGFLRENRFNIYCGDERIREPTKNPLFI